jgi:hypothetical protein
MSVTETLGFAGKPILLSASVSDGSAVAWSATGGKFEPAGPNRVNYTPPASPTSATYTVTATSVANPAKFARATVRTVSPSFAIVRGTVKSGATPVQGVRIGLLASGGAELAAGTSNAKGEFAIPVSATARLFRATNIPAAYFKSYGYAGEWYTSLVSSCRAPLPALTPGTITSGLDLSVLSASGSPPPPPTGCR